MLPWLKRFPRLHAFLAGETGAITVEGVLWVPVYGAFFTLIADVSLMFNGQSQLQRVAQDINRLASSGYLVDISVMEERAEASLSHLSGNAEVKTTIDSDTNIVTTTITVPAADLMAIGLISAFTNMDVTVRAYHLVET